MFASDGMICNYVDDTTIYASDYEIETIIRKLENDTVILFDWFRDSSMKAKGENAT